MVEGNGRASRSGLRCVGRPVCHVSLDDCTMPRSRRKASSAASCALVVSPWISAQRKKRPKNDPVATVALEEQDRNAEQVVPLEKRKEEQLRKALVDLVHNREVLCGAAELNALPMCEIGVLAFEESGGHFVGMLMQDGINQPKFRLTGTKQTESFPDCKYNDSQELYELTIADGRDEKKQKTVYVCNTGGDHAKLIMDGTNKNDELQISFQCLVLHANTTEDSVIAPFFSETEDGEEVVVNIGVMHLTGRDEEKCTW